MVTHRGAPRPPRAWLAAERAAASVGPRAAVAGLLSEEEVAVAPFRVVLAGEGRAAPAAAVPAPGVGVGGPAGLEAADPGVEARFTHWVSTCLGQGSRTIRTEEVVLISLAALRPALDRGAAVRGGNTFGPLR